MADILEIATPKRCALASPALPWTHRARFLRSQFKPTDFEKITHTRLFTHRLCAVPKPIQPPPETPEAAEKQVEMAPRRAQTLLAARIAATERLSLSDTVKRAQSV